MSIRRILLLSFCLIIITFFVNFFVNQRLASEVVTNSVYLGKSENVIRNSNLLHKYMIDMQSGFRGYLLTGQGSFLQPYNEGLKSVPELFKEQFTLITSQSQKARLDAIDSLHEHWIDYASVLIAKKMDTLPAANVAYTRLFETKLKAETGKKINDSIRAMFAAFDRHEYSVRQRRREAMQRSIVRTRTISITLTLFSVAIALLTCVYIIGVITNRIRRTTNLAEEISRENFIQIADAGKDEFKTLIQALNKMSVVLDKNFRELTRKNNELDQFAYVVSHDLKAPLCGIDNITQWIEEDHAKDLTPDVKHNLDLIKGRTARLEKMINGLLDYARIGRVRKEKQVVDVTTLLQELRDMLVPPTFTFEIGKGMPSMQTDKLHLEQVFANLISNAVKYHNRQDGKITVTCRDVGNAYEFSVADDGPGIEQQYHDKIFMIFQTLKERDAFESTGVGLAIVKKVLDEQKGSIRVAPTAGGGTTFVFTWPKQSI